MSRPVFLALVALFASATVGCEEPAAPPEFTSGTDGRRTWVADESWKLYDDGTFFHIAVDPEERVALSPYTDDPTESAMRAWLSSKLAEVSAGQRPPS